MHINQLLWVAGILEGEGYFQYSKEYPVIALQMTDQDTVSKFSQLVDTPYIVIPKRKEHWKDIYKVTLSGLQATLLMRMILPYMGERRTDKIKSILKSCENRETLWQLKYSNSLSLEDIVNRHKELGLSLRDLGNEYSVNKSTIANWIKQGRIPFQRVFINPDVYGEPDYLHWIAGLLDGEGSFKKPCPSSPNIISISVVMTDEDVIAKLANYLDCGYTSWQKLNKRRKDGNLYKKTYHIVYKGKKSLELMKLIKPLMSKRRQSQIEDAINSFDPFRFKDSFLSRESVNLDGAIKMKALHDDGLSTRKIAAQFNCDHNTVRLTLKRLSERSEKDWELQGEQIKIKKKKLKM